MILRATYNLILIFLAVMVLRILR